jgi:uncharacterized protein
MTQQQNIENIEISIEKTPESQFWWEGIHNHELHVQACQDCEKNWFPPVHRCPYCASTNWNWKKVSGQGKVYSWVGIHRAFDPAFADDVPYTILTVQLDEGPRVLGRFIPSEESANLFADMPVKSTYYKKGSQTYLGFSRA